MLKNKKIDPRHIEFLKSLKHLEASFDERWLSKDANEALIICVGSGPWKDERRHQVQTKALDWYATQEVKDFSQILNVPTDLFPFNWQTKMLSALVTNLREKKITFYQKCAEWKFFKNHENYPKNEDTWRLPIRDFFRLCGSEEGTKVLWLFVRDFLTLPAFPIDRHVARNLKKYSFPGDSWYMIKACIEAEVSPNILNRVFFLKR